MLVSENGKTNAILKHIAFVANPENFALVQTYRPSNSFYIDCKFLIIVLSKKILVSGIKLLFCLVRILIPVSDWFSSGMFNAFFGLTCFFLTYPLFSLIDKTGFRIGYTKTRTHLLLCCLCCCQPQTPQQQW